MALAKRLTDRRNKRLAKLYRYIEWCDAQEWDRVANEMLEDERMGKGEIR